MREITMTISNKTTTNDFNLYLFVKYAIKSVIDNKMYL